MQRSTVVALTGAGIVGVVLAVALGWSAMPGAPADTVEPAPTPTVTRSSKPAKADPAPATSTRPAARTPDDPTPPPSKVTRIALPSSPALDAVLPEAEAFMQERLELGEVLQGVPPNEFYRTYIEHVDDLDADLDTLTARLEAVAADGDPEVAARALDQASTLHVHMAQQVRSAPPPSMLSPKETVGWERRNLDMAERYEAEAATYAERGAEARGE